MTNFIWIQKLHHTINAQIHPNLEEKIRKCEVPARRLPVWQNNATNRQNTLIRAQCLVRRTQLLFIVHKFFQNFMLRNALSYDKVTRWQGLIDIFVSTLGKSGDESNNHCRLFPRICSALSNRSEWWDLRQVCCDLIYLFFIYGKSSINFWREYMNRWK